MNRTIKFRAWAKLKNKKGYMTPEFGLGGIPLVADTDGLADLIPMQFTGLLDKNGKEIYEGDIVKDQYNGDILPVRFGLGGEGEPADYVGGYIGWCFGDENKETTGTISGNDYQIIGNIYETPDLLSPSSEEKK